MAAYRRTPIFDHHTRDCRIPNGRQAMTIQPWRATCIQTRSKLAVKAADRAGAWATINENIAHVIGLIDAATRGSDAAQLVVLPEFSLSGAIVAINPVDDAWKRADTTVKLSVPGALVL